MGVKRMSFPSMIHVNFPQIRLQHFIASLAYQNDETRISGNGFSRLLSTIVLWQKSTTIDVDMSLFCMVCFFYRSYIHSFFRLLFLLLHLWLKFHLILYTLFIIHFSIFVSRQMIYVILNGRFTLDSIWTMSRPPPFFSRTKMSLSCFCSIHWLIK